MTIAYLIIEARISDPKKFLDYAAAASALVARMGGRYVVMRGEQQWLEGPTDAARTVVSEWPDRETALAFWNSEEYARIKPLRAGTGDFRVRLVDAAAPSEPTTGTQA
ncbi:MAG TPA: DUF1330 domain-containing protein [Thauera sp.]|nr:DUF1330 domain-containing protein [Thauera sp.]